MTIGDRSNLRGLKEVLQEIRAQVRAERQRQGVTQRELADRMGTSQSQFSGWETDGKFARQDMLVSSIFRAAHILGLDVHVTLTRREQ